MLEKDDAKRVHQKNNQSRVTGLAFIVVAVISALGIVIAVNQIFHLHFFGFMPIGNAYYYYILGCYLTINFIVFPARKKDKNEIPWYDWVLCIISLAIPIYLGLNAYNILTKGWEYEAPFLATFSGAILCGLALEGVRRAAGTALFIICAVFFTYPLYTEHLPGFLWGNPFSILETIRYQSMGVEGVIGIPTRVVGNLLIGFVIFGVALVSTGGGKFFMDFALSLLGKTRGGAAKVSVISSAFMASLSGSVVSNIVTTGSMTIPTMIKSGFSPRYAAAIESCASTGGVIMPPIMGAAGFLIASFLNIKYSQVMLAALFPAILYYLTLLVQVDSYAARMGIRGFSKEKLPGFLETLKEGWFYIGTLVLMIFILTYVRSEAFAPFYAILFLFACTFLRKKTRLTWKQFVQFLVEAGKLMGQITAILAGVGLIVGSLSGTGVANAFSRELVLFAHGIPFFLLVFGAITSLLLGIGMTATACYVFLAIVLCPALVKVGFDPLASHLFVLYWGIVSFITPPVALGTITAASIAGSDNFKTGFLAMRMGMATFILPFFFILSPEMILHGSFFKVLLAVVSGLLGAIIASAALEGFIYFYGKIFILARALLLVSGLFLLYPYWLADIIGIALSVIVFSYKIFINPAEDSQ